MLEVLTIACFGAAGYFVWSKANQKRQENFEYLRRHEFRETDRLTVWGRDATIFDDHNRESVHLCQLHDTSHLQRP